jgi:hypothetical protein
MYYELAIIPVLFKLFIKSKRVLYFYFIKKTYFLIKADGCSLKDESAIVHQQQNQLLSFSFLKEKGLQDL